MADEYEDEAELGGLFLCGAKFGGLQKFSCCGNHGVSKYLLARQKSKEQIRGLRISKSNYISITNINNILYLSQSYN